MDEIEQNDSANDQPSIREELDAIEADQKNIRGIIGELQQEAENYQPYPIERVRGEVGRWLIPKHAALEDHFALVADRARDIDFSPANYPNFDGLFTQLYTGPGFFDPLHDNFPRYAHMRDNIATVRNFILTQYFPDNSPNDTTRLKQMEEIVKYLAEGMNNDRVFLGLVPVNNPFKPFIDVNLANASNGEGARYIYSKILEMQRHSNWTRPFAAVASLFHQDGHWGLDPLPDRIGPHEDFEDEQDLGDKLEDLADMHDALDEKRGELKDRIKLSNKATDLNTLADQLLFTYFQIRDRAEDMAEPIRREAIDIAHDILNKLKMKLGTRPVETGLAYNPDEENDALGASSSVARVLQRMIGMARQLGQDPMLIPAVAEAHQALGQLAYIAKMDALRMASAAGNTRLAGNIRGQLSQMKQFGRGLEGKTLGDLFDKLDKGVAMMRQRMRVLGLHNEDHHHDPHAVEASTVGTGEGSRSQAMDKVRAEQLRKQYTKEQDKQKGANQFSQNQSMQGGQAAQNNIATAQKAVQTTQQAQTGSIVPQGFAAPIDKVKPGVNANVARKNMKAMQQKAKIAFAKVHNEQLHTPLPPKPQSGPGQPPHAMKSPEPITAHKLSIDPSLIAGLGNNLNLAQSAAHSLTTSAVGPQSMKDVLNAQTRSAQQRRAIEANEDYLHNQETLQNGPKPGGRSR